MSTAAANKSDDEKKPSTEKPTAIILFTIAADTTWRMFVPTFGGLFLGSLADNTWHTGQWGALGGLTIGIIATSVLIRQQFKEANKQDNVK